MTSNHDLDASISSIVYASITYDYIFNVEPLSKAKLEVSRLSYLQPNKKYTFDIDLACKNIGVTASHTLSAEVTSYGRGILPTWVTIDAAAGKMTVDTPKETEDTTYTFNIKIKASNDEDEYLKLITLQVIAPTSDTVETAPEGNLTM